jgi:hypothetical protein
MGEEIVASYLYQVHLYYCLEANGYGRYLAEEDCSLPGVRLDFLRVRGFCVTQPRKSIAILCGLH